MLESQIQALKIAIEQNAELSAEQKVSLTALSAELEAELHKMEKAQAQALIVQAQEAVQQPVASHQHKTLIDAVREFEVTHPNLTKIVQSICAQFGI